MSDLSEMVELKDDEWVLVFTSNTRIDSALLTVHGDPIPTTEGGGESVYIDIEGLLKLSAALSRIAAVLIRREAEEKQREWDEVVRLNKEMWAPFLDENDPALD